MGAGYNSTYLNACYADNIWSSIAASSTVYKGLWLGSGVIHLEQWERTLAFSVRFGFWLTLQK